MTNHWMKASYFNDLVIVDDDGKAHTVPIVESQGTPNNPPGDRIRLPLLHWLDAQGVDLCILTVWTMYQEDMEQIVEQVITRFAPSYKDLKLDSMNHNGPWYGVNGAKKPSVLQYTFICGRNV